MSEIQLIVTDVDGTLVSSRGSEVSPSVHDVITRIQQQGKHVVIASGRPADMVRPIIDQLGLHGPQVIDGGATIYDFDDNQQLWSQWIDTNRLHDIIDVIASEALVIDCFPEMRMLSIEEFSRDDVVEAAPYVYIKIPESARTRLWTQLASIVNIDYTVIDSELGYDHVQICDIRATKQHGVERLQRLLGVSASQTLSIGDQDNDLALFEVAEHRVAMGNASDALKQKATYITSTVVQDGWVKAMEHYGL